MAKQSFHFEPPLMNAAGMLGFSPDVRGPVPLDRLGAFITNPVSRKRRKPAGGTRLLRYPSGALIHSGHPNPGLSKVFKKHRGRWERAPLPIIVHLLGGAPKEMAEIVWKLEEIENLMGVEIGLPNEIEPDAAAQIVSAALGELPLMVRLPLGRAAEVGQAVMEAGASALSLSPPRGALQNEKGDTVYGRLYGPAVFPQALEAVSSLVKLGLPVVGGGGVYTQAQTEAMLGAGAEAVQVDTALWLGSDLSDN